MAGMEKLENSFKKANKKGKKKSFMRKWTVTQTPLEILGQVVLVKIKLVVRNLKLIMIWKITLTLV